jgi:hypothetical protein
MKLREKTEDEIMNDLTPFGFVDSGDEMADMMVNEPRVGNWMFNEDL